MMSQGILNGRITRLINNPEALKELMEGKSEEQKRLGRIHAKMVRYMQR